MVVGGADLETWEITHREGGKHSTPGANGAGKTRLERPGNLRRSFVAAGIAVQFDLVAGMAHDGLRAVETVRGFFADILAAKRGR